MAASKEDIRQWFERGVRLGAMHMIVVCDTHEWSDFPVYVGPNQESREVAKKYQGEHNGVGI